MATNSPYNDIRSSSVPTLRFHTERAKYGGPLPTSTGLPYSTAFPGLTFHPATGSFVPSSSRQAAQTPTQHLTKAQLYRLAQSNVSSLIGKRVNRHNQRTGERDPWNYYGPNRRWSKAAASGQSEAMDHEEWFVQDLGREDAEFAWWLTEEDYEADAWCADEQEDPDTEIEADTVWGQKYGVDGEKLMLVIDARSRRERGGRRSRSMEDWRVVRREDAEERWTEGNPGVRGAELDGCEWEVV